MTDRPVEGDHPDYSPVPDNVKNGQPGQAGEEKEDDTGSAP